MGILEAIWHGRDWIFSGIGVVAVVGILSFARRILGMNFVHRPIGDGVTQSHSHGAVQIVNFGNATIATTPSSGIPHTVGVPQCSTLSTLTPEEILTNLNEVPPFQRHQAAKHYEGIRVRWMGSLVRMTTELNRDVAQEFVTVWLSRESRALISFEVSVENYKQLKVAKSEAVIEVEGTISNIGAVGAINLKHVCLQFPRSVSARAF